MPDLLKKMIVPENAYRTPIIILNVYSDKPDEAVRVANELLQVYFTEHRKLHSEDLKQPGQLSNIKIIQQPSPPFANPNKKRIIRLGIFFGVVLGLLAGGGVAGISFWRRQSSPPSIAS